MEKSYIKILNIVLFTTILLILNCTIVYGATTYKPSVTYEAKVENLGWLPKFYDGAIGGTTGQGFKLEALKISLENPQPGLKLKYQVHVQNIGWMDWVYNGQVAGTEESLRIEAVKIVLEGAPKGWSVKYQTHVQNIGWMPWVSDGQISGTTAMGLRIEALKIKIDTGIPDNINVSYSSHVQNIGWMNFVKDGALSGTTGLSLRTEGIKIKLNNAINNISIKYQTHVQDIGWLPWVKDGEVSGTTGKSLRVEAIKIFLENAPPGYHVQYQVHVENLGWMPWVEDGKVAGTTGMALRIEAIRIRVINSNSTIKEFTNQYNNNLSLNKTSYEQWLKSPNFNYQRGVSVANQDRIYYHMNTKNFISDSQKYQFLKLDSYKGNISEEELNEYLQGKNVFNGEAAAFINASKKYNIDTLYLVAHAMWETGYGTSTLSKGVELNSYKGIPLQSPVTVYNFFGIGAYDSDAKLFGAEAAYYNGWTTPSKAIEGGAKWIAENYIHNIKANQKQCTVYEMRWNPMLIWHQYASDINWPNGIASIMNKISYMYRNCTLEFKIPIYSQ